MNITLFKVDRMLTQKQIEINKDKWGSSNWIRFIQKLDFIKPELTNKYQFINSKNIGTIKIDGQKYSVDSELYIKTFNDLSNSDNARNREIKHISFDLFIKDININGEESSLSEIHITTRGLCYSISGYIFLIISIWI